MDTRSTQVSQSPASTSPINVGKSSGNTTSVPNTTKQVKATESSKGPQPPTFNGETITELSCLIEKAQHLVTSEHTEQFTRVYYHNGKYIVGSNGARLGLSTLWTARYTEGRGLYLEFNTGHIMLVQERHCQITYVK